MSAALFEDIEPLGTQCSGGSYSSLLLRLLPRSRALQNGEAVGRQTPLRRMRQPAVGSDTIAETSGGPPRPKKATSAAAMELALAAPRPARPAVGLRNGLFRGSLLGDLLCHDHISFNPVLSPPARLGILRPAATSTDEQLANTTGRAAAHQNGIEAPKQIAATAKRQTSLCE